MYNGENGPFEIKIMDEGVKPEKSSTPEKTPGGTSAASKEGNMFLASAAIAPTTVLHHSSGRSLRMGVVFLFVGCICVGVIGYFAYGYYKNNASVALKPTPVAKKVVSPAQNVQSDKETVVKSSGITIPEIVSKEKISNGRLPADLQFLFISLAQNVQAYRDKFKNSRGYSIEFLYPQDIASTQQLLVQIFYNQTSGMWKDLTYRRAKSFSLMQVKNENYIVTISQEYVSEKNTKLVTYVEDLN